MKSPFPLAPDTKLIFDGSAQRGNTLMKVLTTSGVIALGCMSLNAYAGKPASADLAGFDFTPTLKLSERYDDNFRALQDSEKVSSWITSVNPSFLVEANTRNSGYQLEYVLDDQTYHDVSAASHTDHSLAFRSVLQVNSINRLHYDLSYKKLELTSDTADNVDNDRLTLGHAGIGYTLGTVEGLNQIDTSVNYEQRRYQNPNGLNDDKERNTTAVVGTWYHRLTGKTRSIAEVRYTDFDYLQSQSGRSSIGTAALVGLTWEATAQTTGNLRLGEERKDFSDNERDDKSPTWEVGADWKPLTYSTISLKTRKAYDEGDDDATSIHQVSTTLGWKHEWSDRVKTRFDLTHADREYEGLDRDDRRNIYGGEITYALRRWVDITARVQHTNNDSNDRSESYKRNLYLLSLEFSL